LPARLLCGVELASSQRNRLASHGRRRVPLPTLAASGPATIRTLRAFLAGGACSRVAAPACCWEESTDRV